MNDHVNCNEATDDKFEADTNFTDFTSKDVEVVKIVDSSGIGNAAENKSVVSLSRIANLESNAEELLVGLKKSPSDRSMYANEVNN